MFHEMVYQSFLPFLFFCDIVCGFSAFKTSWDRRVKYYSLGICWLNFTLQTVCQNAYHEDPYAQEFGIKISENLTLVEARILPAPRVRNL